MPRPLPAALIPLLLAGLLTAGPAWSPVDAARLPSGTSGERPAGAPWRLVLYFDGVLASDRSVERAARSLAREASSLTALGTVEVVLAAPEPGVRLGATRDPKLVAAALDELAQELLPVGDLVRHREELRRTLGRAARAGPEALEARVLAAARTEQEAIHGSLDRLLRWLEAPGRGGRSAPKAVLWVADGFDLSPAELYTRWLPASTPRARLREELAAHDSASSVAGLARGLAGAGWATVPVCPGLPPSGLSGGEDLFADPREPLRRVAQATGGEVVAQGEVEVALARLATRPAPPAQEGSASGGELGLPLPPTLARGAGVTDASALGLDDAPVVYLLPLAETMVTGRTVIAAQVLRPDVAAVAFRVGDGETRTDREPPFEATFDLPGIPRRATVRAVALDAAGAELGRDEMEINGFEGELRIGIREPRAIPGPGRYGVELEVRTPRGAGVATVHLAWNGQRFDTLGHPPYRSILVVPEAAEAGSFLQVTATLPDGRADEAVLALGREGFGERVDVDLVHLPTVVRDRRGRPVPGLGPDDFRISEDGREQRLRSLGSAADTPLAVGLAVDVSTSLEEDLPLVQGAAVRFLRRVLRTGDRGQLVAFAGRPRLLVPLTSDLEGLVRAVEGLSVGPSTAIHDALMLSLFHLRGVLGRKAVVLLSDGRDTASVHTSFQSLELARRCGIPVYVLAVGSPVPRSGTTRLHRFQLATLARATGGRMFLVRTFAELDRAYDEIAEELRHQYLLTYASDREPGAAGWRSVEVEVLREDLSARTVAGYFKEE